MRDPDLIFGRIDRVLDECDARQLPPLAAVDPAGTAEHLVVIPVAEAARQLGYEPAKLDLTEPAKPPRRRRWPWSRR